MSEKTQKQLSKSKIYSLIQKGWRLLPPTNGENYMKEITKLIIGLVVVILAVAYPAHSNILYPAVAAVVGYFFGTRQEVVGTFRGIFKKKE